jgi:Na+-driven multidrug efflux pump
MGWEGLAWGTTLGYGLGAGSAALLAWDSITLPAGMGTIPGLGLAAIGAWYAMAADLTVRGLAMLIIFTRKDWSRVRV